MEATRHGTATSLAFGPLPRRTIHLCVDMQNVFAAPTPWHTPWMQRVLPVVRRVAAAHPERTIFTRFITAETPEDATGSWRRYYKRWANMTRSRLPPGMLELVPPLVALAPPARVIDKRTYSPWLDAKLETMLREDRAEALVITGAETDLCVLATVLGAVDRGYRVVLATDAVCSASDESHDALLDLYSRRFSQQVETAPAATILANWP